MKKVLYLHGLESDQGGDKVDFLTSNVFTYAPKMDYRDPNLSEKLIAMMVKFDPDLIIGSSMGGYVAYILGGIFSKQIMTFNPALHSRSFEPSISEISFNYPEPVNPIIILGKKDPIINPEITYKMLSEKSETTSLVEVLDFHHRVPLEIFTNMYNKYIH